MMNQTTTEDSKAMPQVITYSARPNSITIYFSEVGPRTIVPSARNFDAVREALHDRNQWDTILDLMDPSQSITNWGNGALVVQGGLIYMDGEPLDKVLSDKVLSMWDGGFPIDPYIAFHRLLQGQQSNRIARVLYGYLEKHSYPLFPSGCFMAYKGLNNNPYKGQEMTDEAVAGVYRRSPQNAHTYVNSDPLSDMEYYRHLLLTKDYIDIHSSSVPQSVDDVVSMDRRHVNDDPKEGCSTGLHVGAHSYTSNYTVRLLVEVDPSDCVAVPDDSNFSKVRVCKYQLRAVDHVKEEYKSPVYTPTSDLEGQEDLEEDYDDHDDYDEDYGD